MPNDDDTAPRPARRRAVLAGGVAASIAAVAAACRTGTTGSGGTAAGAPPATTAGPGMATLRATPAGAPVAAPSPTASASTPPTSAPPTSATPSAGGAPSTSADPGTGAPTRDASPAEMAARATVPVLCWHQLRDQRPSDSTYDRRLLVCPPADFRAQLDGLQQAGYTTITADQYLAHLRTGAALPDKPVMLSFDDSQGTQISVGLPELVKRRMTATFFVMTVPLDKPRWMSGDDVKHLADIGMTVAAHTWDHHRVDRYSGKDWEVQLVEPRAELEKIVGGPVVHFAYPYGAWNTGDFPHLAAAGYATAFQLDVHPISRSTPLYTIPRILVGSTWSGATLVKQAEAMVHRANARS